MTSGVGDLETQREKPLNIELSSIEDYKKSFRRTSKSINIGKIIKYFTVLKSTISTRVTWPSDAPTAK
jgi:hypothetical protein